MLVGCDPATTRVEVSADALAAAAQTTREAESSRFTMDLTSGSTSLGQYRFRGEGVTRFDGSAMAATFEILMPPSSGEAVIEPTEIRVVDGAMYVQGEALGAPEDQWLHMGPTSGLTGADPTGFGTDPSRTLEHLRSVGDVETVGTETVREVATTHYRTSTPLGRLVEEQLDELASEPALPEGWLEENADVEVGIEAWIADDGLVRRMRTAMELPGPPMGAGASSITVSTEVVLELYDFGVAVDVEAPPADQVIEMDELDPSTGGDPGSSSPDAAGELLALLPQYPGASVREMRESVADGGSSVTIILDVDRDGADADSVASYYGTTLPISGFTVADADSGDPAATAFAIAGHGYEGTLAVAPKRPSGVEVRISAELR